MDRSLFIIILIFLSCLLFAFFAERYYNMWKHNQELQLDIIYLERDLQTMQDTYNGLYLELTEIQDSLKFLKQTTHVLNK